MLLLLLLGKPIKWHCKGFVHMQVQFLRCLVGSVPVKIVCLVNSWSFPLMKLRTRFFKNRCCSNSKLAVCCLDFTLAPFHWVHRLLGKEGAWTVLVHRAGDSAAHFKVTLGMTLKP